jgi:chemotaxis protein histidine kinase CheA
MTPMTSDEHNQPLQQSDVLRRLRDQYRASAPRLVAPFRDLAAVLAGDPHSADALAALRAAAHRLRGTAGSYGFMQVSELAGAFEGQVARWQGDPGADIAGRSAIASRVADALEAAFLAG